MIYETYIIVSGTQSRINVTLHSTYSPHSEPEMRLDGFEMNMGNDYYSSLVACLAYWKKLKMKKFS